MTYEVCCLVCYTTIIGRATSKREADQIAVSHMNAYKHEVIIIPKEKKNA
jgi:hypothetical protein